MTYEDAVSLTTYNDEAVQSTLKISNDLGIEHKYILKETRLILKAIGEKEYTYKSEYISPTKNKGYRHLILPESLALLVLTRYDIVKRKALIDKAISGDVEKK